MSLAFLSSLCFFLWETSEISFYQKHSSLLKRPLCRRGACGQPSVFSIYIILFKHLLLALFWIGGSHCRFQRPLCLRRGSAPARLLLFLPGCRCLSLVTVVCGIMSRFLRRADHSPRGFLQSVVCLSVISKPQRQGLGH